MKTILLRLFLGASLFTASVVPAAASSIHSYGLAMLGFKATVFTSLSSVGSARSIAIKQVEESCMASALYHEARGEPVLGQYAVAATILNRVRSNAYPSTVCGVVYQNQSRKFKCQFSFACDGISDTPKNLFSYAKIKRITKSIMSNGMAREAKFIGGDFQSENRGMTHYHRHDVSPVWSKSLKQLSLLGAHVFFESDRVTKRYAY